jgi:hypothetical protein
VSGMMLDDHENTGVCGQCNEMQAVQSMAAQLYQSCLAKHHGASLPVARTQTQCGVLRWA